mgnify:CR=1 FL=1
MVTGTDIAWAAGFLEGDGCVSFFSGSPSAEAGQATTEPLEKLQRLFGGSIYFYPKGKTCYKPGAPFWVWRVNGARAVGLLLTLYTFMSSRRKRQIEKALTAWKTLKTRSQAQRERQAKRYGL